MDKMNKKRQSQYKQLGLTVAYYRKMRGLTQLQLAATASFMPRFLSSIRYSRAYGASERDN